MIRHALFALALLASAAACAADAPPPGTLPLSAAPGPKNFKQETRALTPGETRAVARLNADSLGIIQRYVPGVQESDLTPQTLDRAYAAWLKDGRADKPDANAVIPAFGVRLGMLALKSCKGDWLHVKDNYGEAVAIEFGHSGRQVYPVDSVNKRYSRGEAGFFVDLATLYRQACTGALK